MYSIETIYLWPNKLITGRIEVPLTFGSFLIAWRWASLFVIDYLTIIVRINPGDRYRRKFPQKHHPRIYPSFQTGGRKKPFQALQSVQPAIRPPKYQITINGRLPARPESAITRHNEQYVLPQRRWHPQFPIRSDSDDNTAGPPSALPRSS